MAKKDQTKKIEESEPKKQTFFFPTLGRTVEATSREEALSKLESEQKEEGGDGEL